MLELFEEDETFLKDFIDFLNRSKFLASDLNPSESMKDAWIRLFVKDFNDAWKKEIKLKRSLKNEQTTN